MGLRLFSYEIRHFNMAFKQNNSNNTIKHFKHGYKWHIMKLDESLSKLHVYIILNRCTICELLDA